jgi:predicted DNA-binding transcriptional regulator YafY/predicted kinase
MKLAIFTRGLPGSGKSELVELLKKEFDNIGIYSTDDFFVVDGEYRFDENKLKEYHQKNFENFVKALNEKDVVVCDNTNLIFEYVKPYLDSAKKKKFKTILVNFIPDDIKLHFKRNIHNVPIEILLEMKDNFDKEDAKFKEKFDRVIEVKPEEFKSLKNFDFIVEEITKEAKDIKNTIKSKYEFNHKTKAALYILQKLIETKKEFSAKDFYEDENFQEVIIDTRGKKLSERRISDVLVGLYKFYAKKDLIQIIKKGKRNYYKWISKNDIVLSLLSKSDDLSWIISSLNASSPEILKDLEERIKRILKEDENIFVFKNYIMETLEGKGDIFKELKEAIRKREYRKIIYEFDKEERIIAKCLKLVFVDNNWYLAIEDENGDFRFLRLSFIKGVKEVIGLEERKYQLKTLEKYKNFFSSFQNSLTLYNKAPKEARILASPRVAKYFKKNMKKFLSTQKFIKENEDGSVEFSLRYTQPLEILPFIKRWLPDLVILSPKELQEEIKKDLEKSLKIYKKF